MKRRKADRREGGAEPGWFSTNKKEVSYRREKWWERQNEKRRGRHATRRENTNLQQIGSKTESLATASYE
jgi:hypothetical protein